MKRETLFALVYLHPQATLDTKLPPEFPGVGGLMLDLCLFYWERIHENKSWIIDLFSAFLQVCGQLRTWQRRKEWLWETSSQTGGSVWGSSKALLEGIEVFFPIMCTSYEKFLCH